MLCQESVDRRFWFIGFAATCRINQTLEIWRSRADRRPQRPVRACRPRNLRTAYSQASQTGLRSGSIPRGNPARTRPTSPHPFLLREPPTHAPTRSRPAFAQSPSPASRPDPSRAPVTEYEEQQELEAARERNDLDVSDLREMSVTELRAVGRDLELETGTQERKDDLVERILERQTERAGHAYATGILDVVDEGFGFLRRHGLLPSPDDVYVSSSQVRRFGLRIGDRVSGAVRAPREAEKYWGLLRVDAVNGVDPETARRRPVFDDLTPIFPLELINLENDPKNLSQRLVNLVNPIGKGQRALIVSPPKAGKTMLLKHIANGISDELPGHPPDGRPDRRAARGSHRHAALASRARSSARPSTSRPRTTPTSPRWPSRSPSARSRPAATS